MNKSKSQSVRDSTTRLQRAARERADDEARRIPWQRLLDVRNQYIDWQEFNLWARSICEVEGRVPDLLGEILNDRCPGFLRTEEALPVPRQNHAHSENQRPGAGIIVLLTPEGKLQDRRREFPQLDVQPIKFGSGELGAESWKFLLGAYGNDSLYVKQIVSLMRRHREALTFNALKDEIAKADLPTQARRLAEDRLALAEPYIDDSVRLMDLIRPGRTIIVDLRDSWIEKDEALGLFVVMMKIFAGARHQGKSFNKLVVFDEAHKYISESELVDQVVQTIREMRHQATSVVIASQDPLSVPRAVIELTSVLLLHRMTSPQWLKHLKGAISALDDITESHLAGLKPGEALVWAQRSTDPRFTQRPYKINIRPRFSLHGGGTKTAVSGYSVR